MVCGDDGSERKRSRNAEEWILTASAGRTCGRGPTSTSSALEIERDDRPFSIRSDDGAVSTTSHERPHSTGYHVNLHLVHPVACVSIVVLRSILPSHVPVCVPTDLDPFAPSLTTCPAVERDRTVQSMWSRLLFISSVPTVLRTPLLLQGRYPHVARMSTVGPWWQETTWHRMGKPDLPPRKHPRIEPMSRIFSIPAYRSASR